MYRIFLALIFVLGIGTSGWAVTNPDGVAVIIGNKVYKGDIPAVDYAHNDAEAIRHYVVHVLGYDADNIIDLRDASKAEMEAAFGNKDNHQGRLWQYLDPNGGSDIIVYYSGHGVPGQNDKRSYMLPANADPAFAEINGYPIEVLYNNLDKLKARSKTVLIDACFSGASPRGMLIEAASPVFIKTKSENVGDGMTVLTAASGDQLASWDKEARHGLFTNYFLEGVYGKADANNDGSVTASEIKGYLDDKMTRAARRTYRRIQEATLMGDTGQALSRFPKGNPPARPVIGPRSASLTPSNSRGVDGPIPDARAGKKSTPPNPYEKISPAPRESTMQRHVFAVSFYGQSEKEHAIARQLVDVVSADLEGLGTFEPIGEPPIVRIASAIPEFDFWRTNNVDFLISAQAKNLSNRDLRIEYRLWDVNSEKQMTGLAMNTVPGNWRRIAHKVADSINRKITGDSGYFDTRVVYVAESGSGDHRTRRLAIMDQDGENHVYLTDGSYSVLTPKFSPTVQEFVYANNYGGKYNAYIFNINTGRQERLVGSQGESFTPNFSADGARVVLSIKANNNYDIHSLDLRNLKLKRLTNHSGMDAAPSFSPDNNWIAFGSNRNGSPQLFVMDANGGNVKMISSGKDRYATPAWSPRGDLIAFNKSEDGKFFIGIIRPDGSGERLLISGNKVFNPAWSPDGRAIMYSRETSTANAPRSRLFVYNLTSGVEREISTPDGAIQADWSVLNP